MISAIIVLINNVIQITSTKMKHFSILVFCLITLSVHSQSQLQKLSVNPIQLLGYNKLNAEFERVFGKGKEGIGFYIGQTGNASPKIHGQYSRLSEENIFYKHYLKSFSSSSFWYGAMISVSSGEIHSENGLDKASNIGALGILGITGYQFIVKSFYITPYLGAGYAITNNLFGSAEYTGNIGKPTNGLLTYGFKTGICF